jgi:hypothetical protein
VAAGRKQGDGESGRGARHGGPFSARSLPGRGTTDARFTFFGLEVELWRIGASPVAPKFNVVSQPND